MPPGGQPAGPGAVPGPVLKPGRVLCLVLQARSEDPNNRAQVSYALGRNFASQLKDGEIDCDPNALMQGINDVLTTRNRSGPTSSSTPVCSDLAAKCSKKR